jgi:hypothetical protein
MTTLWNVIGDLVAFTVVVAPMLGALVGGG